MKNSSSRLGKIGEDKATNFLQESGYIILERNYKNKLGEIDIIAKQDNTLVFVEVKARTTEDFGSPSDAVDYKKQEKLCKVASLYLAERRLKDVNVRFDVIELKKGTGYFFKIEHIKNAFP